MFDQLREFYRKFPDRCNCIIIVAAVMLCFLPSLNYEAFVMDDSAYTGSPYLFSLSWSNIKFHLTNKTVGLYSPLVMLSFMPDYMIWGEEFFRTGCRLQNILWHSGAMILFYCILREIKLKLKDDREISFPPVAALLTALATALHPQRVESVVWIAERKDVMVMTLGLGAIYTFIKAYKADKTSILAPILLFISLIAVKPLMISLPIILTIGYLVVKRPFSLRDLCCKLAPVYAVTLLYVVINFRIYSDFTANAANAAAGAAGESRIFIAFHNIWLYLAKTIFPVKLNPCYPLYRTGDVSFYAMAVLLLLAVAVVIFSLVRWTHRELFARLILPVGLMFGAAVAPVCNLQRIGNVDFADRYSYFPSLFIWLAIAVIMSELYRNKLESRRIICFIPAAYIGVLLLITVTYMPAWKNSESQIDAMLDTPRPHISALKLAAVNALKRDDFDDTLNYISLIAAENSSHPADNYFITGITGLLLVRQGRIDDGVALINSVLRSKDWYHIISSPKGFVRDCIITSAQWHLAHSKTRPEYKLFAANLFNMASQSVVNWNQLESLNYKAISLMINGKNREAEAVFIQALKLAPYDENIQKNLLSVQKRISADAPALDLGTPAEK